MSEKDLQEGEEDCRSGASTTYSFTIEYNGLRGWVFFSISLTPREYVSLACWGHRRRKGMEKKGKRKKKDAKKVHEYYT